MNGSPFERTKRSFLFLLSNCPRTQCKTCPPTHVCVHKLAHVFEMLTTFDKSPIIPLGPLKESPQKYINYHPLEVNIIVSPEPTNQKVLYICKKCPVETEYSDQLKTHEENNHQGVNCEECKKCFEDETVLNNHKLTDHVSAKHKCNQCEKHFNTKSIMEKHMEIDHAVHRPIECNKCDEQFKLITELEVHIQSKHSTKCLLCNLTFTDIEKLGLTWTGIIVTMYKKFIPQL